MNIPEPRNDRERLLNRLVVEEIASNYHRLVDTVTGRVLGYGCCGSCTWMTARRYKLVGDEIEEER